MSPTSVIRGAVLSSKDDRWHPAEMVLDPPHDSYYRVWSNSYAELSPALSDRSGSDDFELAFASVREFRESPQRPAPEYSDGYPAHPWSGWGGPMGIPIDFQ